MPRGYRCILVAFVGWLSLAAANPQLQKNESGSPKGQANTAPPAASNYAPHPNPKADDCYYAKDHESADLCAQWRAAIAAEKSAEAARDANWWAMVAAGLGLFSILGLLAALIQGHRSIDKARLAVDQATRQSKAAEDTLEETRKVNAVEMRPYLFVDRIEVDIERIEWGQRYTATVFLKNFGRLPARDIRVRCLCYYTETLGRLKRVQKEAIPIPVCAPGHERQYFDGAYLGRHHHANLENDLGVVVLRLIYSYSAGKPPTYEEKFDYIFTSRSLDKKLFFILSKETRQRRNEILKMSWRLKKREDEKERA